MAVLDLGKEHRAFEESLKKDQSYKPDRLATFDGEKYVFKNKRLTHKPLVQLLFEVWLNAKVHAAGGSYEP